MKTLSILAIVFLAVLRCATPCHSAGEKQSSRNLVFYDSVDPESGELRGGMMLLEEVDDIPEPCEVAVRDDLSEPCPFVPLVFHGDPSDKLNVVFFPAHFYPEVGPGSDFASDVDRMILEFHLFPLFAENIDKMNIFRIDQTDSNDECDAFGGTTAGCTNREGIIDRILQCLISLYPLFNPETDGWQIVVMFDERNLSVRYARGEPEYNMCFMPSFDMAVFIHEFGHSFGELGDEYNKPYDAMIDPPYPNCASETPGYTCEDKWGDLMHLPLVDCFSNCGARNWFRPTMSDCVMRTLPRDHFCPVCERHVKGLLSNFTGASVVAGSLDIKPNSCPNPLNVKPFEKQSVNDHPKRGGVLPVAVLGTEELNVTDLDVSTLLLEGVPPLRYGYEDVATPVSDGDPEEASSIGSSGRRDLTKSAANDEECECTAEGPDGYMDLTLKFQKSEVVGVLGTAVTGDVIPLTLTGRLNDGTPFEASDCLTVVGTSPNHARSCGKDEPILGSAIPNPFNPSTMISFTLPKRTATKLSVYNIEGKLVTTLVDDTLDEGFEEVTWDGRDKQGNRVATGVYFYRLTAGQRTLTKKMVFLK